MGVVHLGLKLGALGFQRLVAIKRLHEHLVHDAEFASRFKDEIRLVSRLGHPNIVQTIDVVEQEGELALVMEFVEGVTLQQLLLDARDAGVFVPVPVAAGILIQALHGLHAAHEATDEAGRPLQLVHRDISPQNVMVDKAGLAKVLDFGVAKAESEVHVTRTGELTGKAAYMAPEQVCSRAVDRRTDVFASGVVLWEALTGERLFRAPGAPESAALMNVLELRVRPPSELREGVSAELDAIVLRALEREASRRFRTAREFALALESGTAVASALEIADFVSRLCGARLLHSAEGLRRFRGSVEELSQREPAAAGASSPPEPVTEALVTRPVERELLNSTVHAVSIAQPPAPRRRAMHYAVLGVLVALGVGAVWLGARTRDDPLSTASRPGPTSPGDPRGVPRTKPGVLGSGDAARPAVGPTAAPLPPRAPDSAVAAPPIVHRATTTPSAPRRAPRASRGRAAKSAAPAAACSPPTYTDAEGIRHFKPECL
jgi:eukaryotic-like serine/threonine-protein kinase